LLAAYLASIRLRILQTKIVNSDKIHITGKKATNEKFYWHTGHPGGIKATTAAKDIAADKSDEVVIRAVSRMITRSPLGRQQVTNLYVYNGSEHPHGGQTPTVLDIAALNPKNKKRK
jgi:large subunit ribosomal protein L13